jgi:hypothetical protein
MSRERQRSADGRSLSVVMAPPPGADRLAGPWPATGARAEVGPRPHVAQ